jgi:hypothetical protein
MRNLLIAAVGAVTVSALAACGDSVFSPNDSEFNRGAGPASASQSDASVDYTGQGFHFDDGEWVLGTLYCGEDADDGGTGQEVNFDEGYLVWVLTANGAESATLHGGPFGEDGIAMHQVGGTFKLATDYYTPDQLDDVYATWEGDVVGGGNVQLVVSHGCPAENGDVGAWCSPGYWGNAVDGENWDGEAVWIELTDHDWSTPFNGNVSSTWHTDLSGSPSIYTVVSSTGGTYKGSAPEGYDMNAFNAAAAYLTEALEGYTFDWDLYLAADEDNNNAEFCPFDAQGNLNEDFYALQD